jgi:uncharacterized surface anchored protein
MTVIVWELIFSYLPAWTVMADSGTVLAWSGDWHHYCIDGSGYAHNTASTKNDKYMRIDTAEGLNSQERAILFWAMLSFKAVYCQDSAAMGKISAINDHASAAGLKPITSGVSEEDLKGVIHSSKVRGKYGWLDYAVSHGEAYLRLAGLLGGTGKGSGQKAVPALLQSATSLDRAVRAAGQGESYTFDFDPSGRDGDFLAKVPLRLSADGVSWMAGSVNGWNVQKSTTQITLTNPDPQAQPVYLKFDPAGTDYALSSGGFASPDECYSQTLQVWKCVECAGTHATGGKVHPLENHQRTIWMELTDVPAGAYYGAAGKGELVKESGELHFQIYRHEEDMDGDYLVQLRKYDYETGKPLQGAVFELYERFDDMDKVETGNWGQGAIYEEELKHTPVLWDGFRLVTSVQTDQEGHASYRLEKGYHYDKTFCDGHPAPMFGSVLEEDSQEEGEEEEEEGYGYGERRDMGEPEEEEPEEEGGAGNAELAREWLECVTACEAKAEDGTHFHWIMDEVDEDAIEAASLSGESGDMGCTESADAQRAYEESGCRRDCEETYKAFISMKYSYTFVEKAAREGYVLHGRHKDDIPVEIITTDASQNGANGSFGGGYSDSIRRSSLESRAFSAGAHQEEDGGQPENGSEEKGAFYGSEIRMQGLMAAVRKLVEYERDDQQEAESEGHMEEPDLLSEETLEDGAGSEERANKELPEELTGTPSDSLKAEKIPVSTPRVKAGIATYANAVRQVKAVAKRETGADSPLFENAYEQALHSPSQGEETEKGPSDLFSHGGGNDGEEEGWKIYDHRTEGEIHINKRDMALWQQEKDGYSSYGDTQGDAVLEGAVYGLFAADDLIHPDGSTGIVFKQNDLVAITTTDKEGDASFMAITEAPGHKYDYKTGSVTSTQQGWDLTAPKNLYTAARDVDDYRHDGRYVRSYLDNESQNGNCWIGRPLLMGNYYIKELSRSEGYELSVSGQTDPVSNYGYSLDVTIPRGEGAVAVTRAPYVELQSSGEEEDTMPNVINFAVTSQGTGQKGYDIALNLFPEGTKLYRKDTSTREQQVEAVTGQKEKKYLFDLLGQPVYQRADADNVYPKLNGDGSFMTEETAVNAVVSSMGEAKRYAIEESVVNDILNHNPDGGEDWDGNGSPLAISGPNSPQFLYIKMKVEQILRECGFETPKHMTVSETGEVMGVRYSDRTKGIYNRGARQGETDHEGIWGAAPGETAAKTVYGHPVIAVDVPKQRQDGSPVTVGDAILSLLDFYEQDSWYGFGGLHDCKETENSWQFRLYAGVPGSPANFAVLGPQEGEPVIYHRIPWIPDNIVESPRWMYAVYKSSPSPDAFGTYEDLCSWQTLGQRRYSAVLVSDARALGDGTIVSRTVGQNVYYKKGEILRDHDGSPLQAYEWVDVMDVVTQVQEIYTWTEIPVTKKNGSLIGHSSGSFTDAYGAVSSDKEESLTVTYKLVLPRREITLTQEEIDRFPPECGYHVGDTAGYGDYMLRAVGAWVQAYLDYDHQTMAGSGLYVKPVSLIYPGQDFVYQDGAAKPGEGTRKNPVGVQERVIGQSVKVTKAIHQSDEAVGNFRFKVYLKSNLERLYRDQEGTVIWMDRKGNETDPVNRSYPALVPKLYTKTAHKTAPLYKDPQESVIANHVLYGMDGGFISSRPNSGYTAVLETDAGICNYEKFFDAIAVANKDKWKDASPSHTSHRPLGNKVNRTSKAEENITVSDQVRQFAIDWYLDREVEKLLKNEEEKSTGTGMAYSDQLYDQALWEAIKKSENYLKPFFAYDLDSIYAVRWDLEPEGGKDGDETTLSADKEEAQRCFGLSRSLPYGTYVIVEQQPQYAELEDLKNRHYDTDTPKEILVPSVYESYEGAMETPGKMSGYYTYRRDLSPGELASRYQIRFNQEDHVVKAHTNFGDFEIYKYGMSMKAIANGDSQPGKGDYFALTQSEYKPLPNYYNQEDNRCTGHVPYYLTEGMNGRDSVSKVYRYSSVSETGAENTMMGALKAREGEYAQALVPWSLAAPEQEQEDIRPLPGGGSSYHGFTYGHFVDTPYKSRLRIEKLDSQTHENLLHDRAIFRIYKASRDDSRYGAGEVKTYEERTLIAGSRLFLEGMGAVQITPTARSGLGVGERCTGFVPAGTPICREEDQVIFSDGHGGKVGDFRACTTTRDGIMDKPEGEARIYGDQNAGYLETPQKLDAGAYVLVEISPPAGYTRAKPIALELYSDKVAYSKSGDETGTVLATIYNRAAKAEMPGSDEEEGGDLARIYVENAPIKLRIEKKKSSDTQVTYKISGRLEGSLAEIGGDPAYEYAYSQGRYLGYGWKKGTLEYLKQQKDEGAQVDIVYHGDIFAGYGYVTVDGQKWKEDNPYVAGAMMTLYEGLELKPSGNREDHGYEGLVVERNLAGNVTRMYVRKGYAGSRTEFLNVQADVGDRTEKAKTRDIVESWKRIVEKRKKSVENQEGLVENPSKIMDTVKITMVISEKTVDNQGVNVEKPEKSVDNPGQPVKDQGDIVENYLDIVDGIWDAEAVERQDTDILYYDLGDLDVFVQKSVDGVVMGYGYNIDHNLVELGQMEEDRINCAPTDREVSVFAFKGGMPYLELTGGNFTEMSYDARDKCFHLPKDALVYHIDKDGNRDALVDAHTGMAYVKDPVTDTVYVWPVKVTRDRLGRTVGTDKITTSRIGETGEHKEAGYVTGTWKPKDDEQSHEMATVIQNLGKQNMDGEPIYHGNNGFFEKFMRPVVDEHGLAVYFTCSRKTYEKETSLYDRDGDFVRKKTSDLLDDYEKASYVAEGFQSLNDTNTPIYHRAGESYLLENTWITGQKSPNDPFDREMTDGQADILKRVPAGVYIMEELKAPQGYVKGFPTGMTIEETGQIQVKAMEDDSTKIVVQKLDNTKTYRYQVLDMDVTDASGAHPIIGTVQEGKGSFGHGQTEGAKLTLFEAEHQGTHGDGGERRKAVLTWESKKVPLYAEGVGAGSYVLEETVTPKGFVTADPMPVEINSLGQAQIISMFNDHTKVEFAKETMEDGQRRLLNGAGFTLYEAVTDENGQPVFHDGQPKYDREKPVDTWVSNDARIYSGFGEAFEEMYREYGTSGQSVSWSWEGRDYKAEYVSHEQIDASAAKGGASRFPTTADIRFCTEEGQMIRIVVYQQQENRQGREFVFEYQFDYKKLPGISDRGVSYLTAQGMRRLDYLPVGKHFVLVETSPPAGFGAAADRLITVEDTAQIQRYRVMNHKSTLLISKSGGERQGVLKDIQELSGARLALYRADENGLLVREPEYLAAQWVSGSDGVYTETDQINGRIPAGYKKGDKKPHELSQLPKGIYYLVEQESPDYYGITEPVKIIYEQDQQIQLIRMWDQMVLGELQIIKTDSHGELLKGAVFELAAYRGMEREPVFKRLLSDLNGTVHVSGLPVGEQDEDGKVIPYKYRLREVTPPCGYASDMQIHTFWFGPQDEDVSWDGENKAEITITVVNEKTRVLIRKQDFGSPDQWVKGAQLAVYPVIGRDDKGQYLYDEENPIDQWITKEEGSHVLEGLTAGATYLLLEKKAPEGYERMQPYVFTLSEDGRQICAVSGQMGVVTVHPHEKGGGIRLVELQGRYGVKVEMELRNEAGEMVSSWIAGGEGHVLTEEDGIRDGQIYRLTETTVYSDGSREITGYVTRRCHLSEEGTWTAADRTVEKVHLSLTHEDGTEIRSWNPSPFMPKIEVENPAKAESPKIVINGGAGAVKSSELMSVSITCVNWDHTAADMMLLAGAGQEAVIIDPGEGELRDNGVQYTLKGMKPGESRQVQFACQLTPDVREVTVTAVSRCQGRTTEERKTVPVLEKNKLTVFYEVTGTGKKGEEAGNRDFQVFLYRDSGEELKGTYEYEGNQKGSLKSGDILTLGANEFVTIDPGKIYKNIRYKVVDVQEGLCREGQAGADTGACSLFSWEVTDHTCGTVFQKGCQYQLLETTYYSDGTERTSGKMRFFMGDQVSVEGMAVMDRKQTVAVSKKEIAGGAELEGAFMQVKKPDGSVLEEWISKKEPHILKTVLIPGEPYILHEKAAPAGYGYGEDLVFQVTEGECVDQIIMEDKKTHVVFSKKAITGQDEIVGAVMQVLDGEKNVVEDWISGVRPYEIIGKLEAGKTYTLHEELPPCGYAYGEDVPFTVSEDGTIDMVEMRDKPTHVEISKTDITGDKELSGARMEVLDKKGQVIAQWTSGEKPYKLAGVLKAGDTYTLRETAAPDGYAYGSDVKFTVSRDGTIDRVAMKDEVTRVKILKIDAKTGLALAGARLELVTLDGAVAAAWTSTKEAYLLEGKLRAGQTYLVREKKAPSGYRVLDKDIYFTVPKEAGIITVEVENQKKPSAGEPKEPEKPEGPKKVKEQGKTGKVYTDYWSLMEAHGKTSYQTFTNLKLPKMGDESRGGRKTVWLAGLGCLLAAWAVRKKRPKGRFGTLTCLCLIGSLAFTLAAADPVLAETVEVQPEGRLVVTGEVCREESQLPEVLPEVYRYGDAEYIRQSYQVVTAMTEEGVKEVEETITYEEVEQIDTLPETARITVTDQRYNTEYKKDFPVLDAQFYNWRWVSGFELPITVEEADADTYELNGILVPAREEDPFAGFEDQLLALAQINPDYYRIRQVRWVGSSWLGEDGKMYRNAVAAGEKYVADCRAVYGGTAILEPVSGVAWQAVYQKAEEESEPEPETAGEETWQLHAATPAAEEPVGEEPGQGGIWLRIGLEQAVFSVGIFLMLLPLFIFLVRRRQKAHNSLKR